MATPYRDATGVLMFDGPAKITPVIRMLFKPFKLEEEPKDSGTEHYVAVLSEDNDYSWDFYLDQVVEVAAQAYGIDFTGQEHAADVVRAIGAHFKVDLDGLIDSIDFDDAVALADVAQLALLLADGHNLVGLRLEGCWHCDRPRLWEFGGWASYSSKRYGLSLSTGEMLDFAQAMDDGLADGAEATAAAFGNWISRFIDGIGAEAVRGQLAQRFGLDQAQAAPGQPDSEPAAQAIWARTVYIEACATGDSDTPTYACLDMGPAFVASLQSLRALCLEQGLTQVRIADAPDRWRPRRCAEDLRLVAPELVVTPEMFWFADRPEGAAYDIETRPQSIDRFISSASGAGEPLFFGVDAQHIDEENPSST